MFNLRITEVVKNLIIINVLIHLASYVILGENGSGMIEGWDRGDLAMSYPASPHFMPFQIVTHMFAHADFWHLLFNMWMLFLFGPPLEALWGPKRFLMFFFLCGFGAVATHMGIQYIELNYLNSAPHGVWGASGAIMGVALGFGLSFPETKLQLLIPPIPMKALHFVLMLICFDLFFGFSNQNTGVANFAHLGGALTGFLLWAYWRKFGERS